MDKDLTFWFKYKSAYANDRITNDGTDTVFFMSQRPGWSMSTFVKRGMYSAQNCAGDSINFPSYDPISSPNTNTPLDWSNKSITYSNWVYIPSNNLNSMYNEAFKIVWKKNTGNDYVSCIFDFDYGGPSSQPRAEWFDSVTTKSEKIRLDVKYNLLSFKNMWTLFVMQIYEYDTQGNVAIDFYYNTTNIFSLYTNGLVVKNFARVYVEFGYRSISSSIKDQ
jgi:hypothetical protein